MAVAGEILGQLESPPCGHCLTTLRLPSHTPPIHAHGPATPADFIDHWTRAEANERAGGCLSCAADAGDGHGGDAFFTADETEALIGGGFDSDLVGLDA